MGFLTKSAADSSSVQHALSKRSTQRQRGLLCVLLCVSGGCYKLSTPERASAPRPAPVIAAETARVSPLMSKQVGLSERLLTGSYPKFAFLPHGGRLGLIFVDIERDQYVRPAIVIVRDGRYEPLEFDDERFDNQGWIRGYTSYDRQHYWAVMDSVVESPSWELNIVHSADRGATWVVVAPIRKPYYMAAFHALRMRPDGSGELIVLHEDDPANPISNVPAGYYSYTTRDWGHSWSAPVHRPDILLGPDSIPDTSRTTRAPLSVYLQELPSGDHRTP
jgi:hypothetical protein